MAAVGIVAALVATLMTGNLDGLLQQALALGLTSADRLDRAHGTLAWLVGGLVGLVVLRRARPAERGSSLGSTLRAAARARPDRVRNSRAARGRSARVAAR